MAEAEIELSARDARFLRAAQQVLAKYRLTQRTAAAADGRRVFDVTGGTSPYEISVDPDWRGPATCTCPDARRGAKSSNAGQCKHIIAVLLSHNELRCQLLELFL